MKFLILPVKGDNDTMRGNVKKKNNNSAFANFKNRHNTENYAFWAINKFWKCPLVICNRLLVLFTMYISRY